MGPLRSALYDLVVAPMERGSVGQWRRELIPEARGDVLEIGAGTGVNIPLYHDVRTLSLSEPDPSMRRRLSAKVPGATVLPWAAEHIDLPDESLDTVVATLVLCSVLDPASVLREIARVLRPGGRLLFLEHVSAVSTAAALSLPPSPRALTRLSWQRRLDPLWVPLSAGCHLARDTARTIEESGLSFENLTFESAQGAFPLIRPMIRGSAVKT